MKLVLIYGPPASGKFTVAKEVAKITNFGVFHNHLTLDLIEPFFKKTYKNAFWDYSDKLRLDLISLAAKNKIDIIFTFCYDDKDGYKFIRKLVNRVVKNGGKVCFVQLAPDKEVLFTRIKNDSRKKYNKTRSKKKLKEIMRKHEFYTPVRFKNNLKIDNTKLSAKKVAKMIKEHYKLK
jgi:tRNA uridine 5-carbamoylmethylation protein Kti12